MNTLYLLIGSSLFSLFVMTFLLVLASERRTFGSVGVASTTNKKLIDTVFKLIRRWSKIIWLIVLHQSKTYILPHLRTFANWLVKKFLALYKIVNRKVMHVIDAIGGKRTLKQDGDVSHYLKDISEHKSQVKTDKED